MENEREKSRDETEGSGQQQPIGQDSTKNEFGEIGEKGTGSAPPRSMGTKGTEFGQFGESTGRSGQQGQSGTGQSDLGSQADTTLAGRTDQQDLGTDQPGEVGGAGGAPDQGFVGSKGAGSDEYLQERGSAQGATGGTDFAEKGQGATEQEEDEADSEGDQSA